MADLSASHHSETDASNTSSPPDGMPEGQAPSTVNDWARAFIGAVKRFWNRINPVLTTGGGTTAYTLTRAVTSTTIVTGERLSFKINATNTGASTLAVDGGTAKNIYKPTTAGPAALVAGDLVAGNFAEVAYDGTQYLLMGVTPTATGVTSVATAGIATGGPITSTGTVTVSVTAQTAETAPATGDEALIYDVSAAAHRKMVLSDLLKVINGLTEDTTPDAAADFVLTYDTSASAVKKAKPQNLGGAGTVTTIASGSLPAAATLSLTSIPATYSSLHLKIVGASSNTATRHPRIQVSTNNGVSYDTTAGNYQVIRFNSTGTLDDPAEASLAAPPDGAAADTVDIDVTIWGYQGGPRVNFAWRVTTSTGTKYLGQGVYTGSTSVINALQVLWSGTGNFDAGTYALYGIT